MKKLIMVATVAFVAVAANAANVNWKLTAWNAPTATAEGAVTAPTTGTALTDANTTFQLFVVDYSGGSAGSDIALDPTIYTGATVSLASGSMSQKTLFTQDQAVTLRDTYGNNGRLYLKLIATYSDGSYDYTYENTVNQDLKNITSQAKSYNFQGYAANAWTATAVPEPTSGLLMLVGLGALALRRRRA